MKMKLTAAVIAAAALCCIRVQAVEPQKLEFKPAGGGKYIYCNNPEAVDSATLVNSDKPRYIMNNDNLGPGTYYLYLSHYNFIGMENNTDKVSRDMELDVELTPVSGICSYTISRVGFETIKPLAWYENGVKKTGMADWGMFNCCAQAMQRTLAEADGSAVYVYNKHSEIHTVTASETRWLSEFTPNYSVVHYREPVHYQAVLEIKSGTMNVNVCAFKSGDKPGDRSDFRKDAENGIVRYDRTIKGIADTLPQAEAELEYEIDDTDKDGAYLPVISYNQYAPDGIALNEWYTNISPLDDPWAKSAADESGMLAFEYKDKSKLTYYGSKAAEEDKTDIWYFDTHHTDTHAYENQPGAGGRDTYSPNYEITAGNAASGYAVNLGNYGVTYTYKLKITNNGRNDRYFTYAPTTGSRIIVYTDEKDREPGFGLIKKGHDNLVREVMSVVKLPAGQTTEFSVNMILPVNYNGGMKNAFIIRDSAEEIDEEALIENVPERVYVKPINGKYLSEYRDSLPPKTLAAFDGTLDCCEVISCGGFYAVRWCEWDGSPNYYSAAWRLCSNVYILDEDFNVTGHHTFDSFPSGMSFKNDKLYVRTLSALWESENGTDWVISGEEKLPEYEPEYTLGDALDRTEKKIHTISFDKTKSLTDREYELLYNAVKDIRLNRLMPAGGVRRVRPYPAIDGIDIMGWNCDYISLDGGYYGIADENDREFVKNIMNYLYIFSENAPVKELCSDWAAEDIKTAAEYGFLTENMSCMTLGTAQPYKSAISRGAFCNLAVRVLKYIGAEVLPEKTDIEFSDSSWIHEDKIAAEQLAALGVVNGYEDGTFRPQNTITREEAAAILARLLDLYSLNDTEEAEYSDAADIQSWAGEAVGVMSRYRIMNGVDDTHFDPKGTYTGEQSVVTLLRVFNAIADNGHLSLPEMPSGGKYCTVYREGYRNGRIELAVYDTEEDSGFVNDNGVLSMSGSYTNDVKYYFCSGRWVRFESGYERISNNAQAVLWSSK